MVAIGIALSRSQFLFPSRGSIFQRTDTHCLLLIVLDARLSCFVICYLFCVHVVGMG
jgi:hypothetical protein